jgi:hypothetical protein
VSAQSFTVSLLSRAAREEVQGEFEYVGPELPEVDAVIPVLDRDDAACRIRARVVAVDEAAVPPVTAHELYTVRVIGA